MLEMLTKKDSHNAISLLVKDHRKVKDLFDQFEETEDRKEKIRIAKQAIHELKVHAAIEEEIFYPTVRRKMKDDAEIMNEADEEHHVAKVLIAELEDMDGSEDHFEAKFVVLAENIRHHIREEEGEMLPKAKKTGIDFEALGEKLETRKHELLQTGVPEDSEAKMVAASHGQGDSPAQNAKKARINQKRS